jgi:hypothetical protein|tara:strand:+ start:451 stop:636 length:186 start_codon:yes stop_codon:yes gene_type:complete
MGAVPIASTIITWELHMFEKLVNWFIKRFNIKEEVPIKYLSGIGKSSNYDGGEIGSTDGDR